MRHHSEPTIHDLLADPLIHSVMKADRVDPDALGAMLDSLAPRLRNVKQSPAPSRVPVRSGRAFCPTGCAW